MARPVKRRPYSSPVRETRARQTREQIAGAARRLFAQHGYTATTIEAIAEAAGVAVQTVYAAFGTKRAILWSLLETAVAGDAEPRTLLERAREELADCPDAAERLRRIVAFGRRAMDRSADIHRVMREAAAADREVRRALEDAEHRRYQDAQDFVGLVAGSDGLSDSLSLREATDLFFALAGYGPYEDLVVRRSWPGERYDRWIVAALRAVLIR
ncbi:MAG TPA: helix-turn-helix domain-containing protein [Actinomycetota bacterium]|jgi:AcrR family transcriptional regulator|nr:helix-turn-helix domain-containing protein [Actinomycetota bacterium]